MNEAFVGRHRELQILVAACKESHGAVFVRGDAGVGKTRLLEVALAEADVLGGRVLRASCDELDRAIPYAGLRSALRPSLAAELAPELADAADAVAAALDLGLTTTDTDTGRARDGMAVAFEAARRLVARWAEREPVVLALDDLHAADPDTLRVFGLFAAHLRDEPVTLLATLRRRGPEVRTDVAALVERLVAEGLAMVVDLYELDASDTRALVHDILGARPDDALVHAVWEASRGNPYYATEALRSLCDAEQVRVAGGRATLDAESEPVALSARASLLHRIFQLGSDARRVSRALTAFQRFTLDRLDLVADIAGIDEPAAERAFDDLVAANVLRPVDGTTYEFAHPIVRATLYEDIGPAERRRLHARIAERLRADRDAGQQVSVVELGVHVAVAAQPGDRQAIATLVDAGRTSVASAPLTAARWFAQARALLPVGDPDNGVFLAAQARALFLASRPSEAADAGRDALANLPPGTTYVRTAAVVIQSLTTLGHFEDALALADSVIEQATTSLPRIRAMRAVIKTHLDRFDEAEADLRLALDEASDDQSRSAALGGLATTAFARGRLDECRALLDRQAELDERLGPGARLASLAARASYLALAGVLPDASAAVADARQLSEKLGGTAFRAIIDVADAVVGWLEGRWDDVVSTSRLIGVDPERAGVYAVTARCAELVVAVDRGEFTRARELATEVRSSGLGATFGAWSAARLELALGELTTAAAILEAALDHDRETGRRSAGYLVLASLAEVALVAGDQCGAERWAGQLADEAARGSMPWARLLSGRLAARLTGDPAPAAAALALAEQEGLVVEAARGRALLGAIGVDPAANLVAAHDVFRRIGAEPELRAVVASMREAGITPPRPPRARGGALSETERELARLVHEGLTNRQIGRVLFLSPKTVEVYLSRVYAKTGCASRLELALALSEGRLGTRADRPDQGVATR